MHSTDGKAERAGRVTQAQEGRTDRSERTKDSPAGANGKRISVEYAEVTSLRPSDDNPRVMPEEELLALERSVDRFGLVDPLVVRRQDRRIIGGHQRLVTAQRLGLSQVPVVFVEVSEDEARLLNLALNRIQGHWDEPKLAALLQELESLPDLDLCLSGFGEEEVDELLARVEALDFEDKDESFDLEKTLEQAQKECRVQRGDLWLLGRHRLLCGDATTRDVERLLSGEAAHRTHPTTWATTQREPFRLYRVSRQRWEDGYARYHQALLSSKNRIESTGGNFIPAIKVLKHVRSRLGLKAVSFHLECLLYAVPNHLFFGGPADYITAVLSHVANWSADTWYYSGLRSACGERDVFADDEWDYVGWRQFHNTLVSCARCAQAAQQSTNISSAISYWQLLLGDDFFPEQVS